MFVSLDLRSQIESRPMASDCNLLGKHDEGDSTKKSHAALMSIHVAAHTDNERTYSCKHGQ